MVTNSLSYFYKGKRILIPGGAGFIGSNLAKALVKQKAKVTVVDPLLQVCGGNFFNLKSIEKNISFFKRKIEQFLDVKEVLNYDIIFNCIGLTNHHLGLKKPYLDFKINCLSGLYILETVKNAQSICKVISIGSKTQYGNLSKIKPNESAAHYPMDFQSIHKSTLDFYHHLYSKYFDLDTVFIRLTNVYGSGQKLDPSGAGFMGEIIRNALLGHSLTIYGSILRKKDIIHIDDVTQALLLLGTIPKKRMFSVYNVGGRLTQIAKIVSALKKANYNISHKILPFPITIKKLDSGEVILNSGKIRKELGWEPSIDIEKGIKLTMDYYHSFKQYYL